MKRLFEWIGVEHNPASIAEKLISGVGGFVAVFAIYHVSYWVLGDGAYLLVASLGASTVLLFAVPHGALSQPWPLFGGNLLSACIGVFTVQMIPDLFVAAGVAVGVSVLVMHVLKCIHPPGGATALMAVIGGEQVHQLGYMYVITPVLLNVFIILVVAVVFNNMFSWRRYPASLMKAEVKQEGKRTVSHEGVEHALKQIDSFIDVSEEDLNRIYALATDFDQKKTKARVRKIWPRYKL